MFLPEVFGRDKMSKAVGGVSGFSVPEEVFGREV